MVSHRKDLATLVTDDRIGTRGVVNTTDVNPEPQRSAEALATSRTQSGLFVINVLKGQNSFENVLIKMYGKVVPSCTGDGED